MPLETIQLAPVELIGSVPKSKQEILKRELCTVVQQVIAGALLLPFKLHDHNDAKGVDKSLSGNF